MATALRPAGSDANEVEVRWEDQQKINKFGALTNARDELKDQMAYCKKAAETEQNALDAIEEGEINFFGEEGVTSILLGESFIACTQEEAQEYVESLKTKTAAKLAGFVSEMDAIEAERTSLRAALYARFGDSIGLDDAEE